MTKGAKRLSDHDRGPQRVAASEGRMSLGQSARSADDDESARAFQTFQQSTMTRTPNQNGSADKETRS
jgi:hypothetical protein